MGDEPTRRSTPIEDAGVTVVAAVAAVAAATVTTEGEITPQEAKPQERYGIGRRRYEYSPVRKQLLREAAQGLSFPISRTTRKRQRPAVPSLG